MSCTTNKCKPLLTRLDQSFTHHKTLAYPVYEVFSRPTVVGKDGRLRENRERMGPSDTVDMLTPLTKDRQRQRRTARWTTN